MENKENPGNKNQKDEKKITWKRVVDWILQILVWLGGILLLYVDVYEYNSYLESYFLNGSFTSVIVFEGVIYWWYVVFQFCTPNFCSLRHKKNDITLIQKMKEIFTNPLRVEFVCQSYHFKVTLNSINGSVIPTTEKEVTRVESKFFDFYSSRDVSGLFALNYDKSFVRDKFYIQLDLSAEACFADAVTYSDYKKAKDEFLKENEGFDTFTELTEVNHIEGLTAFNLINIVENNNPCGISAFWYAFFVIIGFAEIYKFYVKTRCIYKTFTIKKLVSTRYGLNTEECDNKYNQFNPSISFGQENLQIATNKISSTSDKFELSLPSQEEIESSQQYNDKVFNAFQNNVNGDNIVLQENNGNFVGNNEEDNINLKTGFLPK